MDNSLTIPKALTSLIESGFWPRNSAEANRQHQCCLVPEAAIRLFAPEEEKIYFYPPPFSTVRQHQAKTSFWSDSRAAIHEIKPDLTLIIGDFGIGSDAALLLDYSQTATDPRVLRLKWAQEGNHWVEVAATFDQFAALLKGQKNTLRRSEQQT